MGRDIHYCPECGDEIFADMELCSMCENANKGIRKAFRDGKLDGFIARAEADYNAGKALDSIYEQ